MAGAGSTPAESPGQGLEESKGGRELSCFLQLVQSETPISGGVKPLLDLEGIGVGPADPF